MSRTPRNRRVRGIPRIWLQARDREIILAVYENRFLQRDQIERLFFSTTSATNQRLMPLYQHRFLDRLFVPVDVGSSQAVYALDRNGAHVVAHHFGVSASQIPWRRRHNRVEFFFLEHTLAVAEVNVALQMALSGQEKVKRLFWRREAWLPAEKLADPEGGEKQLIVAPDAFFGLETNLGRSYFFVEADMGTETLERFRRKLLAYQQYWKTGAYQERYSYKNFRVLTVTTGAERANNLIRLAGDLGAKNMFLFTTQEKASKGILGPVWYKPPTLNPISILD